MNVSSPHLDGVMETHVDVPSPHLGGVVETYVDVPSPHVGGVVETYVDVPSPHVGGVVETYVDVPSPHVGGVVETYVLKELARLPWYYADCIVNSSCRFFFLFLAGCLHHISPTTFVLVSISIYRQIFI